MVYVFTCVQEVLIPGMWYVVNVRVCMCGLRVLPPDLSVVCGICVHMCSRGVNSWHVVCG